MTAHDLTLSIDRRLAAPRAVIWRCWSEPDLFARWHAPAPWRIASAALEVRPGGRFETVMEGPDGERMASEGSFVEVVPGTRLIFTDAFAADWRPLPDPFMTGVVALSDAPGGGTRMVWSARHATADARDRHLAMGFELGWNACVDQLDALAAGPGAAA